MKHFDANRILKKEIVHSRFKWPIPLFVCQPKKQTSSSHIFLFICGLNGTSSANLFLDNNLFDNNYFVLFDRMAHGENKNKASRKIKKYLNEILLVVQELKKMYPNKKIYLIGESWGSGLAILFYQKYSSSINGVFVWNMPTKIVNVSTYNFWQQSIVGLKIFFTFLTNITTYDYYCMKKTDFKALTNNPLLARINKIHNKKVPINTKLNIISWFTMRRAWKFLNKEMNSTKYNFVYLQSKDDVLYKKTKLIINFLMNAPRNHVIFLNHGTHILSFDKDYAQELFDLIAQWANK